MATKQIKELRNLSAAEQASRLREVEEQLFRAKMQKATSELSDTAMLWRLRKARARLKMLMGAHRRTSEQSKAAQSA